MGAAKVHQHDCDLQVLQAFFSAATTPSGQTIPASNLHEPDSSLENTVDSRIIPLLTTVAVVVVLSLQASIHTVRRYRNKEGRGHAPPENRDSGYVARKLRSFGGAQIALFMLARLLSCMVLCGLSVWTVLKAKEEDTMANVQSLKDFLRQRPEVSLTVSSAFSSLFLFIAFSSSTWRVPVIRGSNTIMLSTSAVYFRRDVWPYATYDEVPLDGQQGSILWIKIALLFFTACFVPLFIPRKYVPVNPKDPMPEANPEQTCSLFSLVTYTYLDPILRKAYNSKHLSYAELPPLMDSDYSRHLTARAFKFLDPFQSASRRHIFFSLMRVYWREYTVLTLMCIGHVFAQFAFPVSVNRILKYIETGGEGAKIKPWVWAIVLMSGPLIKTLFFQWYTFITTRTLCRNEAIITQLVFDHSLRIRMKAEVAQEAAGKDTASGSTVAVNPENASITTETLDGAHVPKSRDQRDKDDQPQESSSQPSTTSSLTSHSLQPSSSSSGKAVDASSTKGKERDKPAIPPAQSQKKKNNMIGKINNLVTSDLQTLTECRDFLLFVVSLPVLVTLCVVFLYSILGWSAFVGLAIIVSLGPIPGLITKRMRQYQSDRMKITDARVQDATEAVGLLRMIKLFGWEKRVLARIEEKRETEINWIRKIKVLEYLAAVINQMIPTVVMLFTYATYTVVMRKQLDASIVFSSVSAFALLRAQLSKATWQLNNMVQGKVALDRIQDFLRNTELLDEFSLPANASPRSDDAITSLKLISDPEDERIGFRNIEFSWSNEDEDGSLTPTSRRYRLRFDEEFIFKAGGLNLIVGPTGSGKTSILMALLGEMHAIPRGIDAWYNLPRRQGVAYAAQESWVQNATIRDNILFGSAFDEDRYQKVIYQCALEHDLKLFEAKDETEVGERGLTLSGGQKARLTLARAVYSDARIVLLDDILSALDVHTSTWVVNKCLNGDLLRGRTVLIVAIGPLACRVVTIDKNGHIQYEDQDVGTIVDPDEELQKEALVNEAQKLKQIDEGFDQAKTVSLQGKLVVTEEIAEGHVTWRSFSLLFKSMGGNRPWLFFSLSTTLTLFLNGNLAFQTWWLGHWGTQYEKHDPSEVNVAFYLGISSCLVLSMSFLYVSYCLLYLVGSLRASRRIHKLMMESILTSTLRWLDETPTGRILTRCTQDIRTIDHPVPRTLLELTDLSADILIKLSVLIIFTPIFVVPALCVATLGLYLGNFYLRAQLSVRREMSNAKAPVLSHFTATMNGLISVRAYGAQGNSRQESLKRIDHYTRTARTTYNLNRWISVRVDLLGSFFIGSLAIYLVYVRSVGAANTGFSINMAIYFASLVLWWVRLFNDFEIQSNSLERIQAYIDIDHETKPTKAGVPPAAWPTSGDIRVENLSARYSETGPLVLHNLSFNIKSGERIGVVGRTGSGKSSLTLSLLRCIVTEGRVYYDGIPTDKLNLDALRENITIIPQTPELLSGTLRRNLDPFEQHDDAVLNNALQSAGLFSLQQDQTEAKLTLDSEIASGGSNLSVGQRQVLALARAIVRQSKLLILDEATSAIDYKTDTIIQSTLRERLGSDVTVITVAHRLQTIMDADRIMVLDSGRLVEFGSPKALLAKEGTLLKALVDESQDKAVLYAMVMAKDSS